MIRVVTAAEEDLPLILEIEHEAISPPWTHGALLSAMFKDDSIFLVAVDYADETRAASVDAAADSSDENRVVSVDAIADSSLDYDGHEPTQRVVGFAVLRHVGDDGELLQIAVDKSVRGRGIGDMLMISVLDHVVECALDSLFLEVRKSNAAAVGLYKKHGFESVRVRKDYYHDPVEDALVMVKEILRDD